MTRSCNLVVIVAIAGCNIDLGLQDVVDATVYDDGQQLTVVGCTLCTPSVAPMSATVDGTSFAIPPTPASGTANPTMIAGEPIIFAAYLGQVPRPTTSTAGGRWGSIDVAIGDLDGTIALPSAVAISAPTEPVSRSGGAARVTYTLLDGATVSLWLSATCGTVVREDIEDVPGTGVASIDVAADLGPAVVGSCAVTVTVDQLVQAVGYDAKTKQLATSSHALREATFTSVP